MAAQPTAKNEAIEAGVRAGFTDWLNIQADLSRDPLLNEPHPLVALLGGVQDAFAAWLATHGDEVDRLIAAIADAVAEKILRDLAPDELIAAIAAAAATKAPA